MERPQIDFHPAITAKLDFFLKTEKIPNIIFHGQSGSGKRTIVNNFVSNIYHDNKELMKAYIMNVNCAHGKGIKFVREDLKFFAKTHINIKGSGHFKTVILSNADKLTIDAQSALRRCIELFSHTTRFFIIVEDKYKLLKPILSRLCEIFVSETVIEGKRINLHRYGIQQHFHGESTETYDKKRDGWFTKTLNKFLIKAGHTGPGEAGPGEAGPGEAGPGEAGPGEAGPGKAGPGEAGPSEAGPSEAGPSEAGPSKAGPSKAGPSKAGEVLDLVVQLYEKGYSGLDLMDYIEHQNDIKVKRKYHLLLTFHKVKKEFRNEKLLMLFILNFLVRSESDLENLSFM
jgi:hypothetical protein